MLITPDARKWPLTTQIAERSAALGAEIIELKNNRLIGLRGDTPQKGYVAAKTSLAVTVAPPGSKKLQPIPPSADWQFHVAQGCPAHCQYCYLAGSLSGPPVTKVFANAPEILDNLKNYVGRGNVTTGSEARHGEGTTFEVSCYTDPLSLEHLTGSLAECIRFFAAWQEDVQLRWTTKFDNVGSLVTLPHGRKTRVRFSVSAEEVTRNFEGGTASLPARLRALHAMAEAGYPVGLTIAPIMAVDNWQEQYSNLLKAAADAIRDIPGLDLTAEMITHRFTPKSKLVQLDWYPKTKLDLEESGRSKKMTKFGSTKFVYPSKVMNDLRSWFTDALQTYLPQARTLYWT